MLTFLECLYYMSLTFVTREFTIPSSMLLLRIEFILRFLIKFINSLIKQFSSSLFLASILSKDLFHCLDMFLSY